MDNIVSFDVKMKCVCMAIAFHSGSYEQVFSRFYMYLHWHKMSLSYKFLPNVFCSLIFNVWGFLKPFLQLAQITFHLYLTGSG